MENASKALIIAGAILIAILLISVGILVMNSANKTLDEASNEGNSMSTQIFNTKFTNYLGTNKDSQTVKQLCTTIIASNNSNAKHQIRLQYKTGINQASEQKSPTDMISLINNNSTYTVYCSYAISDTKANGAMPENVNSTLYKNLTTEKGYIAVILIMKE